MENNEMMMNEVTMENVAVEGAVEAAEVKGGKTLAILAIGGLVALVGFGLYKAYTKNVAKAKAQSDRYDANQDLKNYVEQPAESNSL